MYQDDPIFQSSLLLQILSYWADFDEQHLLKIRTASMNELESQEEEHYVNISTTGVAKVQIDEDDFISNVSSVAMDQDSIIKEEEEEDTYVDSKLQSQGLINLDGVLFPNFEALDMNFYRKINNITRGKLSDIELINSEMAEFYRDDKARESVVNRLLIQAVAGKTKLKKEEIQESYNKGQPNFFIDLNEVEVNTVFSNIKKINGKLVKDAALITDILSAVQQLGIKVGIKELLDMKSAVKEVAALDSRTNHMSESTCVALRIQPMSTNITNVVVQCAPRNISDNNNKQISNILGVTLSSHDFQHASSVAVIRGVNKSNINMIAHELKNQLKRLYDGEIYLMTAVIYTPYNLSAVAYVHYLHVYGIVVFVDKLKLKMERTEIQKILFMSGKTHDIMAVADRNVEVRKTIESGLYNVLPDQVKQNRRCIKLNNLRYLDQFEITEGLSEIIDMAQIVSVYYSQLCIGGECTYYAVIHPDAIEPAYLQLIYLQQCRYDSKTDATAVVENTNTSNEATRGLVNNIFDIQSSMLKQQATQNKQNNNLLGKKLLGMQRR
jgi:hypothetical protein